MYIELQFFFLFPQAAQYIGEICRYLLNSPPSDADKKHKVGRPLPPPSSLNTFKKNFKKHFKKTSLHTMLRNCSFLH